MSNTNTEDLDLLSREHEKQMLIKFLKDNPDEIKIFVEDYFVFIDCIIDIKRQFKETINHLNSTENIKLNE